MVLDQADRTAVAEFAALCAQLGDEDRLIAAFERLPRGDSRRAAFGLRAFRLLLPRQRYADALGAMPFRAMASLAQSSIDRPPPARDARSAESHRRFTVGSLLDYIEVLAGANELAHAEEMIAKLKAFDPSAETNARIEERLKRARPART